MDHPVFHNAQTKHHHRGQIQLIFGPMFSGKTTELLRRINRFKIAKYKVIVIKYAKDDRYDDECVSTHDRHLVPARKAVQLSDVKDECMLYDVIGVDEGQFFPDVLEFAETMANFSKTVIVAALDGTYQRQPFGRILELVPKAESIIKLSAVCIVCNEDAAFTRRYACQDTAVGSSPNPPHGTDPIASFQVELIGGADKYLAVCRACYQNDLPREFSKLSDHDVKRLCSPMKCNEENESKSDSGSLPARKLF